MSKDSPPSSPQQRSSPISSPLPPPSPPSSPLPPISPPSSPHPESPPRKRRTWLVYRPNSKGEFKPSRSTQFLWAAQQSQCPSGSQIPPDQPCGHENVEGVSSHEVSLSTPQDIGAKYPLEHDELSDTISDSDTTHGSNISSDYAESEVARLDDGSASEHENEPWLDANSDLDSESSDGDFLDAEPDNEQRVFLYEGCEYTVDEAVLDMVGKHIKRRGTQQSLQEDLTMFNKFIPKPNLMPTTLFRLLKYVKDLAPSYEYSEHLYCADCLSFLIGVSCSNCPSKQVKKFYSFSLESQLRYYYEKCKIYELFKTYESNEEGLIRDICDGSEYKKLQIEGIYRATLMLNTDGISLSRSSKTSLYPIQYIFCELPPELRRSYMVVCGVWCDTVKPPMNMFLRPFVEKLQKLFDDGGFTWKNPDTGLDVKSVVLAPFVCADAPVRSQLQNIMGHNSKYACNTCEQKTQIAPLSAHEIQQVADGKQIRRSRAFLFQEEPARLRTNKRMMKQASQALNKNYPVKGVKGPAVLTLLTYLNLASCVYGEYMHLVCLGVVRLFLNLWFYIPGPWNISCYMKEVDQFLCNIRPPNFIGRLPRGVKDMKQWKASEFRAWLLFYSLPVLAQFLPHQYLQHWSLLVMGIHLLLKEEIKSSEVEMSEAMIRLFCRDIGNLYRHKDYVYNVHELLHLPVYVKRWGPLWATSAFMFEDYNGDIAALLHGTKNKAKELMNSLQIAHGVEVLRAKIRIHKVNQFNHQGGVIFKPLQQCKLSCLTAQEQNFITSRGVAKPFSVFSRMEMKERRKEIFTSTLYSSEKKRNNYSILYFRDEEKSNRRYGEIKCFVSNNTDKIMYALIHSFKVQHCNIFFHAATHTQVAHIVPVLETQGLILIPCSLIISKMIRVGDFLCSPPNYFERNNL